MARSNTEWKPRRIFRLLSVRLPLLAVCTRHAASPCHYGPVLRAAPAYVSLHWQNSGSDSCSPWHFNAISTSEHRITAHQLLSRAWPSVGLLSSEFHLQGRTQNDPSGQRARQGKRGAITYHPSFQIHSFRVDAYAGSSSASFGTWKNSKRF